jgi:hypothetical protein
MNKDTLLTLTDEQVEKIVAAHHEPGHPRPKPPCDLIQATTLACGEEGPCSVC